MSTRTPKFYKVCAFNFKHTGITTGKQKIKCFKREILTLQENMCWTDAKKLRGTTRGLFIIPQSQKVEVEESVVVEVPVDNKEVENA